MARKSTSHYLVDIFFAVRYEPGSLFDGENVGGGSCGNQAIHCWENLPML